jgi:hypothetical protein
MPLLNDELLNFDALDTAEKITGKSYKTDKDTELLGLALLMGHKEEKKSRLAESCDTYFSQSLENYLSIVNELGFKLAYTEKIIPKTKDDKEDTYYIFYHPEGIILSFDSYWGNKSINGGNFYYNWRPNNIKNRSRLTSSGSFARYDTENNDYIWSGYHDCREALRYNINRLREHGSFVTPWLDCPILWFSHYGDKVSSDDFNKRSEMYKTLSKLRMEAFPQEVKDIFGPILMTLGVKLC